jgi:hypothetical protein
VRILKPFTINLLRVFDKSYLSATHSASFIIFSDSRKSLLDLHINIYIWLRDIGATCYGNAALSSIITSAISELAHWS